jgi:P27 family predicted phage terminase small subunit
MRGPKPKPVELHLLEGARRGKAKAKLDIPKPPSGIGDPPEFLSDIEREKWSEVVEALKGTRVLTSADRETLAQYSKWWVRYLEADAEMQWGGMVVYSMNDVPGLSPHFRAATEASKHVERLGTLLGLNPSARVRLGKPKDTGEDDPFAKHEGRAKRRRTRRSRT